jgi:hypothetical protein
MPAPIIELSLACRNEVASILDAVLVEGGPGLDEAIFRHGRVSLFASTLEF